MNPNIEQINKYLMGVKFSYIEMDWVKDFPLLDGKISNPHMALTTEGILLLNKDDPELYDIMKSMFTVKIMPLSDKKLHTIIQGLEKEKGKPEFDKFAEVYIWMLLTEQKRRTKIKRKRR